MCIVAEIDKKIYKLFSLKILFGIFFILFQSYNEFYGSFETRQNLSPIYRSRGMKFAEDGLKQFDQNFLSVSCYKNFSGSFEKI